jgi:hypothetical protein
MASRNVFPDTIHVRIEDTGDLTAYEKLFEVATDDGQFTYVAEYKLVTTRRVRKIVETKET